MSFEKEKKDVVFWARLLNERGFVTARSGNVSLKVEDRKLLITSHDSYLGFLDTDEVLVTDLDANVLEGNAEPAVEKDLHTGIYKRLEGVNAVIHSHAPFATAFFHYFDTLESYSFESRFYLGEVRVIPQETPTVTDVEPVISALEDSAVVVLKNHGVVAVGESLKSAFGLMEVLEEQARVNLAVKAALISPLEKRGGPDPSQDRRPASGKKYRLLSREHCERLKQMVNQDTEVRELGRQHDMTCSLAVKNADTGHTVCFYYDRGKIVKMDHSENADFRISGREDILRKVFNRQIDPFVASTQGKVETAGDFAKMSRWYPVLVRTFKLWAEVPVEPFKG